MGFKIPGPKSAALGQFKAQCEAWVDAFVVDDEAACGQIRKAIREQPDSLQRRIALAYVDKKARLGVKPKVAPEPVRLIPIDTMREAVDLLAVSRRPFALAVMDGVRDGTVSGEVLSEIQTVCEAAIVALRRRDEYRSILTPPESIQ